jgi:O-antigen/teichoic acid export membrane protein
VRGRFSAISLAEDADHRRLEAPGGGGGALRRVLRSRLLGQSAAFTAGSVAILALGALGKVILAGHLKPRDFGAYAFATSLLAFAALFFEFGAFTPAARRMAHARDGARAELAGASLAIFLPIGAAFCLSTFALSFLASPVFGVNAGAALRAVAPLAFAYAFTAAASQLAQGSDRVATYTAASLVGQILFVAMLAAVAAWGRLTVTTSLVINTVGILMGLVGFVAALRPRFDHLRMHVRAILRDVREWGLHMYVGRVLSVGTYNMDTLMVAAFTDAKAVGWYVLAGALAQASGLPVVGLGSALFSPLARATRLEWRWLGIAWGFGALGVVGVAVLAPVAVDLLFSSSYHPVVRLALPLALAQAVRGVTSVYNTFLSAHGHGRELRTCGIVLTGSNLVLNFALIPPFGALGAAWASFGALGANYGAHVWQYTRVNRRAPLATVPIP